ncbi:MAG: transcriptional regulator, LysR family [Verrucomicrobiaceae bacterium]|nr:transcriptional regulator, LysR family [Verrucomicrobiaceae bacterium]
MHAMHEYLVRKPFDLYALHLYHLVVRHRSFTKAAREAGMSQSAMTRQMQSLEEKLGVSLIVRTTRSVGLTDAGEYLAKESARLVGSVSATLEGLQAAFGNIRPVVRVGVSRTIAMAHMPGLFHANQQRLPMVACQVKYQTSAEIISALEQHELDVGVLCPPKPLPESVKITHQFKDAFTLIGSKDITARRPKSKRSDLQQRWLQQQQWLMIEGSSVTGGLMRRWLKREGIFAEPAMELDSFDLIINLAASGMGVSLVPQRALALYRRREAIVEMALPARFTRELVVLTRKHRKLPAHVENFIANILF